MHFPFGLADGDKFAILALTNAGTTVTASELLPDGTAVAAGIPEEMVDEFWQRSLGSIAVDAMRRCNLLLLQKRASATPELLDVEHEELGKRVIEVFWLLQLSGVPYYEGAAVLKGSVVRSAINIRAHDDLSRYQFLASNGAPNPKATIERLKEAAGHAVVWRNMLGLPGDYTRFKRGLNILLEGLQEHFGQERLHAFVRALEALILPSIGKTKKHFITRCQTFATPSPASQTLLAECFDMRSAVEHMNNPDACLSSYPVQQREAIALRRVRQLEAVASSAYKRLLSTPILAQHFKSDGDIAGFWQLPQNQRQSLWGSQVDPCSVL